MAGFLSCFSRTRPRKTRPRTIGNGNQAIGPSDSSEPTSSRGGVRHEVFLSFRGPETRNSFTSHLYQGLKNAGVGVYIDTKEILASAGIHRSLMEAIENSTVAVPVFSKDYASSTSCLREVGRIYECRNRDGLIVLPIFYHIEPSDVRHQKGPFEESFRQHEQRNKVCSRDLNHWKKALKEIGELKGFTIWSDQNEAKRVEEIVSRITELLKSGEIHVPEYLVGMDPRVQAIVEDFQVSFSDVRILGICGISGIGKTTLAKVVYNKLRPLYDHHAFISKIEATSEGLYTLQRQLISQLLKRELVGRSIEENKSIIRGRFNRIKVLIVLDNFECSRDVEAFAGDLRCFAPGSRIIVTTQNATLIEDIKADLKHSMQRLDDSDSLRLFCWHAFGRDFPLGEYDKLSNEIVVRTGGIPSVIKAVGCYLSRDTEEGTWRETLQKLENADHESMDILTHCYNKYLGECERQIFLDIACFLDGKSKSIARYMWDVCCFYPHTGVKKLCQLSFLNIGENDEMLMANPVKNFGKKLVIAENHEEPELRSRLSDDVARDVLRKKRGNKKIQALCLNFDGCLAESLTNEAFNDLLGLRFLRLGKAKITGNFENLLPKLRWLDLKDCSDMLEELKDLSLEKLVILDISHSKIKQDWQGWELIMKKPEDLKVFVLTSCQDLQGSPKFTDGMRLERLCFENCKKLRRINTGSSALESLVSLNLKGCTEVNVLPKGSLLALRELIIDETSVTEINFEYLGVKNLKTLSANRCKNLATIDDSIAILKSLSCLMLDETAINRLPDSIGSLRNLQNLSLKKCKKLHSLPESIGKLSSLSRMDLSYTTVKELPLSVEDLKLLKVLLMENTPMKEFPESITKLERLEKIDFSICSCMKGRIPDSITNLSSLTTLLLSATAISSLPDDISGLSRLQILNLWECKNLEDLPRFPTSLTTLHVGSGKLKKIPELSDLKEIVELHLADNASQGPDDGISELWPADGFQWFLHLPKLETLVLHISKIRELPNLSDLNKLRKLVLSCRHLQSLPNLPPSVTTLHLNYCKDITEYGNLSILTLLTELKIEQCGHGSINLERLRELRLLKILDGGQKVLRGIEELHHLRELTASNCSIQGLSELRERGTKVNMS